MFTSWWIKKDCIAFPFLMAHPSLKLRSCFQLANNLKMLTNWWWSSTDLASFGQDNVWVAYAIVYSNQLTSVFRGPKSHHQPFFGRRHRSAIPETSYWARLWSCNHKHQWQPPLWKANQGKCIAWRTCKLRLEEHRSDIKRQVNRCGSSQVRGFLVWLSFHLNVLFYSYGGHLVAGVLSRTFKKDFEEKVFAVGFTDSVHGSAGSRLAKIGVNFVSSDKPLGEPVKSFGGGMPAISAGTPKHEMTSYSCMEKLFEFLDKRYKEERGIPESSEAKKPKTENTEKELWVATSHKHFAFIAVSPELKGTNVMFWKIDEYSTIKM